MDKKRPLAPPTGSYASTLQFLNPAAHPDSHGLNTPGASFSGREVVRSPTKTKVRKPVSKGYIFYDFIYITLSERQNYRDGEQTRLPRIREGEGRCGYKGVA